MSAGIPWVVNTLRTSWCMAASSRAASTAIAQQSAAIGFPLMFSRVVSSWRPAVEEHGQMTYIPQFAELPLLDGLENLVQEVLVSKRGDRIGSGCGLLWLIA